MHNVIFLIYNFTDVKLRKSVCLLKFYQDTEQKKRCKSKKLDFVEKQKSVAAKNVNLQN